MISKSANELELYRECFGHLSEENNIFSRVLYVLEIIAGSRSGLGEVMEDYAVQACSQLKEMLNAGQNLMGARQSEADMDILHNSGNIMKTISKLLELIPSAMRRNHAETIGRKEKVSRADIEHIYHVFSNATETKLLMTYEAPVEYQIA